MNRKLQILIGLFCISPATVFAFQITFAQQACSVEESELEDGIQELQDKLNFARVHRTKKSQYRKHVEGHINEVIEIFVDAQDNPACSPERKARMFEVAREFADLINRRGDLRSQRLVTPVASATGHSPFGPEAMTS